ncbi:AraC family transcriptional regulator [Streptomyces sp. WAC07061]|uniref:AraC family transcriptional regulator n=1 Tax=Streptomyces sp. WAC07061 TaxID=2487410 RepID=UPI00163CCCE5|nr:AraC family transcriptional regulator [Streptomyces sp. WAC07061]
MHNTGMSTVPDVGGCGRRQVLFRGGDVEELHELISTRFAPHHMDVLDDAGLDGRFECAHQGSVTLYELGYGAEIDITPAAPLDFYNINIPLVGGGGVTLDGKRLSSTLHIAGPGQEMSMRWGAETFNRILLIPREVTDRAVSARLGELPDSPLVFDPVLDDRADEVQAWLRLTSQFAEFLDSPLAARSPLALGHFEKLLVDGLLDVQAHTFSDVADGIAAAVPRAVRRARDFCADHAHEPISPADMAQAAGISVQSLREGFRRHLDTTPLAYLRGVRLMRVRRDLVAVAEGRATGNVTGVALRWGFTHLGRFTGYYREAYGEAPSQTLRNTTQKIP